jgi:hypothetical protein
MPAPGAFAAIHRAAFATAPIAVPSIGTAKFSRAVPLRRHTPHSGATLIPNCSRTALLSFSQATVRHLHPVHTCGGTQWLEIAFNLNWKPTMI